MILSGNEIYKEIKTGRIKIEPFEAKQLNPNSYNLTLADEIWENQGKLDMKKSSYFEKKKIIKTGMMIYPNKLYLAKTIEYTETHGFIPCIEGRSSVGRLGINIHATAGFGENGYCGNWTLEISCIEPVKIYPFVQICQIYYSSIFGELIEYTGKYQKIREVQPSLLFTELDK